MQRGACAAALVLYKCLYGTLLCGAHNRAALDEMLRAASHFANLLSIGFVFRAKSLIFGNVRNVPSFFTLFFWLSV